ncbi:MAG: lamin tail domain-containing protein [Alphaproteobacteria bacterium]|nr:lamin tail domain-containing protein [Alphaproteobacteria bacterium]
MYNVRNLVILSVPLLLAGALAFAATTSGPARPKGPCDIYAAAGDPCTAAHSTTRALFAAYNGPLYQVMRQSDGKKLNIGVVKPSGNDAGGYADAAAQDRFCANTVCWITTIYDQSGHHNELTQAPRGAFSGPAMGGFNNVPVADMAPASLYGHKVYGVFIEPGMGLRQDDAKGTAVDDQAEGQYWVINGHHFNNGCCFDYGNAEIDSKDDGNGTMETAYYGDATAWYHGTLPGPWPMTDQENNLVGCVNPDPADKLCKTLPQITWHFVTAMAKGEPHHWTSLSGDAQKGDLLVIYDGGRVNNTYDPMRKQGAILLGNGGDNSNGSQGTFYEGAMTKGGTFPSNATDQAVQANVVAAHYDVAALRFANTTGLVTLAPGAAQDVMLTFTNVTGAPVTGVAFSLSLPKGWTATAATPASYTPGAVAPGASVSQSFHVTSGTQTFNGDLVGNVSFTAGGAKHSERTAEKVRNVAPVKINEFRIGDGPGNTSNSFIELYNGGADAVDISGWTLTQHQTQQAIFSAVTIPAGTRLASKGFYLLGLANSGLAAPAKAGDSVIHVRSVAGMKVGDTVNIGGESRRITALGTAASPTTTVWQPLPDGPIITIPKGATNVPVTSTEGFTVGQKIALGHGATYPAVSRSREQYEVATVTQVGKPGAEIFLGADAAKGATNISVTSVASITAGDKIRLDIATLGHGVETVTVKRVGTAANWLALTGDVKAGAGRITLRAGNGVFNGQAANAGGGVAALAVGRKLIVGMPGQLETVTVAAVNGNSVDIRPALARDHLASDPVIEPGTGLDLAAPLKFAHAANLPVAVRGTGISFSPASAFARSSNEPVMALGTGLTLDRPLSAAHEVDAVVRDDAVTSAGYQGTPNQWFGGPALSTAAGAMILRDAAGHVADSLNYGLLVDPWAAEGYQGASGVGEGGCRVVAPGGGRGGRGGPAILTNSSAGRPTDGADADSNCTDFRAQTATVLPEGSAASATNIKTAAVAGFAPGQVVMIDNGAAMEQATIANIGTPGAARTGTALAAGATVIPVTGAPGGFAVGQAISVDGENASVAAISGGRGGASLTVAAPLTRAHPADALVAGSGITLTTALTKVHPAGAQVISDLPTPGAANKYGRGGRGG